jgi:hypothetical protein
MLPIIKSVVEHFTPDRIRRSICKRNFLPATLLALLQITVLLCPLVNAQTASTPGSFKQYADPAKRFVFEYPASMKIESNKDDYVKIFHPKATLRISIFLEKRPKKTSPDAQLLLAAFKKRMKEDMKDSTIIEEGKLPGLEGSHGYVICSFTDSKGSKLVQLVQYYVTDERILQMVISDRPEGFENLKKVINHIHRSLKILKPKLDS